MQILKMAVASFCLCLMLAIFEKETNTDLGSIPYILIGVLCAVVIGHD